MSFSPTEIIFVACISTLTFSAAVIDTRTRKIPNYLTASALVLGIVFRVATDGIPGLAEAGAGFAVGFGALFVLWICGGGGGGDVKLMGALGIWLGFKATLAVLVLSSGFALVATLLVAANSFIQTRLQPSDAAPLEKPGHDIAFALPIALATWLVVALEATSIIHNVLEI